MSYSFDTQLDDQTYRSDRFADALRNLGVDRGLDFRPSDVFERRKNRVLNFSPDGGLDDTGRVLRQLGRNQLQDLFLAREIRSLLGSTGFFEPLLCEYK